MGAEGRPPAAHDFHPHLVPACSVKNSIRTQASDKRPPPHRHRTSGRAPPWQQAWCGRSAPQSRKCSRRSSRSAPAMQWFRWPGCAAAVPAVLYLYSGEVSLRLHRRMRLAMVSKQMAEAIEPRRRTGACRRCACRRRIWCGCPPRRRPRSCGGAATARLVLHFEMPGQLGSNARTLVDAPGQQTSRLPCG